MRMSILLKSLSSFVEVPTFSSQDQILQRVEKQIEVFPVHVSRAADFGEERLGAIESLI